MFVKEIKSIINLPKQEAPDPGNFTSEFFLTFKDQIISGLFQKIEAEGILSETYSMRAILP